MRGLNNPVLGKELKLRFRSFKSFSALLFYLLTLLIFVVGFFLIVTNFEGSGFIKPEINVILFTILTFVQLALILFITPGLTAGEISGEREKQTLNILLTTAQTNWQIIFGKLMSSISYIVLLLFAGLPITSIVFIFGGVSPKEYLLSYTFMIITMVTLASVGILFSTLLRKTVISMISTYGVMLFLTVFSAFFAFVAFSYSEISGTLIENNKPFVHFWLSMNPIVLMATIIYPSNTDLVKEVTNINWPTWASYLIIYTIITIVSLAIATAKIRVKMTK
ncbi:ABC transporter permease [Kurthia sibirica]|uniref:ABC transporter permease n=1 Tax=Kurthia sibirica TaxID=202750 RepID=A0A2U3AQF2_9BACL|nr:ABC transporter permease subunit [Kurthia sibirica]PWI26754.1 ABC transporter permease [Kurthia sibirica]GEK32716.1 hypothetical protein KSI01_02490 [Kurthia sibirica]